MPTYQFCCHPDDNGCGHVIELNCLMSEYPTKKPSLCPHCQTELRQILHPQQIFSPATLGHRADVNTDKMSSDQKEAINRKNNDYRPKESPWVVTPEGIKHKKTLK